MRTRVRRLAFAVLFVGGVTVPGAPVPTSLSGGGFTAGPLSGSGLSSMTAAACDVIKARLQALVRPGGEVKTNCQSAIAARHSRAYDAAEAAAVFELSNARIALAEASEEYIDARTAVNFVDSESVGSMRTLTVEEESLLTYARIGGDEPEFTSFDVQRAFTFAWNGFAWELSGQALVGIGVPPIDEPTGVSLQEMRDSLAESRD